MKELTGAARLIIIGIIAEMLVALLAVIVLTFLKKPIPTELSTVPAVPIAALTGILARTHPDNRDSSTNPPPTTE